VFARDRADLGLAHAAELAAEQAACYAAPRPAGGAGVGFARSPSQIRADGPDDRAQLLVDPGSSISMRVTAGPTDTPSWTSWPCASTGRYVLELALSNGELRVVDVEDALWGPVVRAATRRLGLLRRRPGDRDLPGPEDRPDDGR
jgi:hypothetical protein